MQIASLRLYYVDTHTMSALRLSVLLAAISAFGLTVSVSAQSDGTAAAVVVPVGWPQTVVTSITLGQTPILETFAPVPFSLPAPVNITPASTVRLSSPFPAGEIVSAEWHKDSSTLPVSTPVLDIATATPEDSGRYFVVLKRSNNETWTSDPVTIRVVAPVRQQLLNLSSRATISPANPTLISGFVVASAAGKLNETKTFLIRAVGPTLATLGVAKPLAAPRLALFRADGSAIRFPDARIPESVTTDQVATRVGAFPLGSPNDKAFLLDLPAGAYTAHVTSADGGSGDALLEIYEVPDSALDWLSYWPEPPVVTTPQTTD